MRTRVLLVTAALATAALATAGGVAAAGTASAGSARTLKAIETFTKIVPEEAGTKGVPVGDRISYATVVKDLKGVKLGIGVGECIHVTGSSGTDGLFNCLQTYRLAGGDFVVSGIFSFEKPENTAAITGGTGKYRGVTGEMESTTQEDGSFADIFHFNS